MTNKWIEHLKKERKKKENKGKSLKEIMTVAKKTYSK